MTLLSVEDLRIAFPAPGGAVHPVDGVSFTVDRGETLALVGESGCGKSLTALALLQLVPPPGRVVGGRVRLGEVDVTALRGEALRAVRGRRIGMVFQDPLTSLNPVLRVGDQVAEGLVAHGMAQGVAARRRAVELLREVGIADAEARADAYPHQLSGGMRQRVGIAIALAAEPELLVADEPTTALDVTVQAQILELIDQLRQQRGMGVLLITHDLGIVAGRADRVAVMYAGQVVEACPTAELFAAPAHPYTRGLLASVPRLTGPVGRLTPIGGTVPPPAQWPPACRFEPRCPERFARCASERPTLLPAGDGHVTRCWLAEPGR
ncbi:MAG TPA: ABC transporter ATP-binding protein [Gemmatimonadales bacterium]|jgi:oligopeptide/dipeptide ABC transporter ATP-binding protein|nr:ABC transporter ATP-binding protein [Gemmatimonadales bacterium]